MPLDEECASLVVALDEPNRTSPDPALECVGFVVRLAMTRRVELQHHVPRGHDERPRRVEWFLQHEPPLLGTLGDEAR